MDCTCFLKPEQLEDFEEHRVNKGRVDSSPCAHPCTPRVALLVHEFAHRRHESRDAPSSNRYYAGEELEARPAETARTMDILLDEPIWCAHTEQLFENTTQAFRGFVPTNYPQTSMCPNSMAAELGVDAPLSFLQPGSTEGFGQSSYDVRTESGETQAHKPARFPGTIPRFGYTRVDVDGAGFEQTSTEQGLHMSSGTVSAAVFEESPPHAEEGNSAEHPFTRLPPVLPGVVGREIHPGGRYHPGLTSSLSTPDVLDVIREIYAKPALGQADVEDLIVAVETLLYIARIQQRPQLSSRTPIILLANELSGYFLMYDAVVSAAVLLQTELTQYSWWEEFTGLHDTGVVLRGPTSRAQKSSPAMAFNVRLVNRLSAALDILKTGVLPGKGEIRDLKLLIFCHKYSPKHFRNARWSP
ncbi:hypothetical protein Efla_000101 [Eimeria flavescens]